MGKEKYLKTIGDLFGKSAVVNYSSIERVVRKKKNIKQYTKKLIRNLILKGKIKKITRGFYTSHDDPSLAVYCFKPAYLGLQDALSFHNLWEQESIPVIITARKARQGIRKIMGINVLIRRIDKKYCFGFQHYDDGGIYLPYSDVEKTFIDMVYFKEKLSQEAIKNIERIVNIKKINSYINSYPNKIRKRVLDLLN